MSNRITINDIERYPTALNFTVTYAHADDGASTVELSMQIPFTNTETTGEGAGGVNLYYPVKIYFTGITGVEEPIFYGQITAIQLVHSNDGIIWDITAKTDLHIDEESDLDRNDFTNLRLFADDDKFPADSWDAVAKILKYGNSPRSGKYQDGAVYPKISSYVFDLGTTRLEAAQEIANLTGFLLWDDGLGWRFETPNNRRGPSFTFYVKWHGKIPPNITNASFSVDSSGTLFHTYYIYVESGAGAAKKSEGKLRSPDAETGASNIGQLWKFNLTNQILTTVQEIAAPLTSAYAAATGPEHEPAIDRETNSKNFNLEDDDPLYPRENYTDCLKEDSPLIPNSSATPDTVKFTIHPPVSYDPKNSTLTGYEIKRAGGRPVGNVIVGASDTYDYTDDRHIDSKVTTYVYNVRAFITVNAGEVVTTQWSHNIPVARGSGGGQVLIEAQLEGLGEVRLLPAKPQPGDAIYNIPDTKFTYEQIEFPWSSGESEEAIKLFALWTVAKKIADSFSVSLSYPAWTGPSAGDLVNLHWSPELDLVAPAFFNSPLRVKSVAYALDANMGYTAEYELIPSILFDIITPYEARATVADIPILTLGEE